MSDNDDTQMWTSRVPLAQRRAPVLAAFEAKNHDGQVVQRVMINLNEILWVDEDDSLLIYMAGFHEPLRLHMTWKDFNDRLAEIAVDMQPRRQ